MSNIAPISSIQTMTSTQIEIARQAENYIKENLEQLICVTEHTLHSGVYTRTVFMPKGSVSAGVVISVPTTLILQGKMAIYIGDEVKHIDGYNVITALGNRKQIAYAIEDSYATLIFKTNAKTIIEAEQEMTEECDRLMSRHPESINIIKKGV